jgi:hypothetical protein
MESRGLPPACWEGPCCTRRVECCRASSALSRQPGLRHLFRVQSLQFL